MVATFTNADLNAMADAEAARIQAISLHTATPGTTGASEATGGSPAYARKTPTFTAAGAQGVLGATAQPATVGVAWSDQQTFDLAAGTYTHFGVWSSAAATTLSLGTTNTSGGSFGAGTYYWKVTAIFPGGEGLGSNEVTATLVASGSQVLNWTAVSGATGYKIYRGTAAGSENALIATVGAVTTYTDTGGAGSAGTVPSAATFHGGNALAASQTLSAQGQLKVSIGVGPFAGA